MLIAIHRKADGEVIHPALLTIWWTRLLPGISPLSGIGAAVMLPFPTFFKYRDLYRGALMQGMRLPTVALLLSFTRGDKRKWVFKAGTWMRHVGQQKTIATREEIEDGLYPPTKEGAPDVQAN